MSIRTAEVTDVNAITSIAKAAYALYVPRMGSTPAPMVADFTSQVRAGQVIVFEQAGRVVGFCVNYPRGDHVHLENVAVDPAVQGQGIGGKLITAVENHARSLNKSAVELYTNIHMTENQQLYPALGYVETARSTEDGFERVFYRKTFSATSISRE